MGLANELLKKYETQIESISLVPSDGGCFEVTIGETLIYSKLQTGNHARPGEVIELAAKILG